MNPYDLAVSSLVTALAYLAIAAFAGWVLLVRRDVPSVVLSVLKAFVIYPSLCGLARLAHAWAYWRLGRGMDGDAMVLLAQADWLCAAVASGTAIGLWRLRRPVLRVPTTETWRLALAGAEARCERLEQELRALRRQVR